MPLVSGGANAEPYNSGVEFDMDDDEAIIRIRVSNQALLDKEGLLREAHPDFVDLFHPHQTEIEAVASRKFDAGIIERDGSIFISSVDLKR